MRMPPVSTLASVAISGPVSANFSVRAGSTEPSATMVTPKNAMPMQAATNALNVCFLSITMVVFNC